MPEVESAAVSAPVAAPAASAPPAAPAPVSAPPAAPPPVESPVAPPAATAPPAAAAVVTTVAEPKAGDYENNAEGQTQFMNDHMKWERDNPAAEAPPVEAPKVEEPKVEPKVEEKKEEPAAPKVEEPEESDDAPVTPEVVNGWMTKNPALKAALDADPVARRQMFAMARVNSKAQGLLDIFPDTKAGEWANQEATVYSGMKHAFMRAVDDPEQLPAAMESFASQFKVVDKEGKPVVDAKGNPLFSKDFELMSQSFVFGALDDAITDFEEICKTSTDDQDNVRLSALTFVKEILEGYGSNKEGAPDLSKLTPEQRTWQENQQRAFDAERQRLGLETKKLSTAERRTAFDTWDKGCKTKIGSTVGRFMDNFLAEKARAGTFMPSYVTDVKDPADGQSSFGKLVFDEFNKKVMSVGKYADQLEAFSYAEPTAENETRRVEFYGGLVADLMPGIMEKHFKAIQKREKDDRLKRQASSADKNKVAEVEPQGGAAPGATGGIVMTDEAMMAKAYSMIDASHPDISAVKRTELALNKFNELAVGRR